MSAPYVSIERLVDNSLAATLAAVAGLQQAADDVPRRGERHADRQRVGERKEVASSGMSPTRRHPSSITCSGERCDFSSLRFGVASR